MAFIFDSEEEFDAEQAGGDDAMDKALAGLLGAGDLAADEAEWDPWAGKLHLTYRDKGWYEGCGASMSGPAEPAGFSGAWAEDAEDDVESDMTKISDAVEKLGYGIAFDHADVKKGIADAETEVKSDPEMAVRRKQGRYGDWDYTADCHVEIPVRISAAESLSENGQDDIDETDGAEEALPEGLVNETLETLRRMY